jgi:hypothetical protein
MNIEDIVVKDEKEKVYYIKCIEKISKALKVYDHKKSISFSGNQPRGYKFFEKSNKDC